MCMNTYGIRDGERTKKNPPPFLEGWFFETLFGIPIEKPVSVALD